MAIEPKEVEVRGGPPADGRVRALAGTGDSARAEEEQATRDRASQSAATALRNGRADQETRRSTRTHEDITDRQNYLHVIPQRRAAEEEKKTAQQARLDSIREQQAALAAQPLVRWLFTVPAEDRVEPLEVQLAATEILTPAEARREPAEARPVATEILTPAEARREPAEAQLAATEGLTPEEGPKQLQKESAELKEPKESAELKEPEDPGGPEEPIEPKGSAGLKELRGMRRAREGGTAAKADTVGVRREAERFAEDAKMDPGNCLMEILALKENQEGIRIRRSPGDCVEHLP